MRARVPAGFANPGGVRNSRAHMASQDRANMASTPPRKERITTRRGPSGPGMLSSARQINKKTGGARRPCWPSLAHLLALWPTIYGRRSIIV